MKILLPDSLPLAPALPLEVEPVIYDAGAHVPDAHLDAEALVVWGNSFADLAAVAERMPELRWVQTLAAGPDAVLAAGFPRGVLITSGSACTIGRSPSTPWRSSSHWCVGSRRPAGRRPSTAGLRNSVACNRSTPPVR